MKFLKVLKFSEIFELKFFFLYTLDILYEILKFCNFEIFARIYLTRGVLTLR